MSNIKKFTIPIEVQCAIAPAQWTLGTARPTGWFTSALADNSLLLSLVEPAGLLAAATPIPLEDLPDEMARELEAVLLQRMMEANRVGGGASPIEVEREVSRMVTKHAGHLRLEVLICGRPRAGAGAGAGTGTGMGAGASLRADSSHARVFDPWRIRDEFLRLRRSTPELLEFLNRYGEFDRVTRPGAEGDAVHSDHTAGKMVLPHTLWRRQDQIRQALRAGPSEWFAKSANLEMYTRSEFPHFVQRDSLIWEGMNTTVTVDFLRGVKFRECARHDCDRRRIFIVESHHERRYCENYCAHLESVRRAAGKKKRLTMRKMR